MDGLFCVADVEPDPSDKSDSSDSDEDDDPTFRSALDDEDPLLYDNADPVEEDILLSEELRAAAGRCQHRYMYESNLNPHL